VIVGNGLTVTILVEEQPVIPSEYVTVAVPADTPNKTPVADPTNITEPEPVQEPPGVASVNVIVCPLHTAEGPAIAAGSG
jgi:hypothetical protein